MAVTYAADGLDVRRGNMFGCAAAGVLMAILGALGVWAGLAAMFSTLRPLDIGWLLPLSGVYVSLDPLGGFFIALLGAVAIPVGVYSIGYGRHLGGANLSMLPLFVAAMLVVPAAGSVTTFLLGWELMAAASLVLVLAEHRRPEVRSAGLLYAAMTQLGFVAILVGLMVMSASAGTDRLAGLSSTPQHVRGVVFVLTVVGFGSKAGLLPLHAWLPRAHPEAPSPVSALMSAAMVTLGIYGIVRFDLQVLGPGPRWWGLVLLAVGGASAVYGVLQSAVATDLKRLLAYSTTENMGLIALALGAAVLLADAGASAAATIAMTAAMLHLVAHAAFKSLGFLGAGSVLVATGLRDLDRLGGLVRRMPTTTLLFGLAALGASGLPLGAGFVSEWLLIQSLVHASDHNTLVALAAPVAVGAVALTTGLGVAAMVKAFGIGFLARPRSAPAESAVEVPPSMLIGMWIAAIGCLALGVVPAVVAPVLRRVLEGLPAVSPVEFTDFGSVIRLPGVQGSVAPGLIGVGLIVAIGVAIAMTGLRYRSRPPAIAPPLWACGADDLSSRMQYTATSFAEPLERVFDDVLRPDTDIEVTHHSESQYMVEAVRYRARITDGIETHLYAPLIRAVLTAADLVRRAHTGSVHRYLAFGALGVLLMLVAAR